MRSLRAVPLVLLSLGLPACAQRGGAHAGFAGSAPAARGSFSSAARSGSGPSSGRTSPASRYGAAANAPALNRGTNAFGQGSLFLPPGITSTRPVFYSNGIRRYGDAGNRSGRTAGVGYGYFGLGYLGDFDAFDSIDPAETPYPQGTAQDAFAAQPPEYPNVPDMNGATAGEYGPPEQAPPPPPFVPQRDPGAPPSAQPYSAPAESAAPPPEEEPVTIVFKDGRPSEQIHNYALTRTTLYVTGVRVRSIPVEQIDLQATEKINQKAGVEFQLPTK